MARVGAPRTSINPVRRRNRVNHRSTTSEPSESSIHNDVIPAGSGCGALPGFPWWVSTACPPNPACDYHRTGFST